MFGSSGFRGKGFQFDANEAQLSSEKRRMQKAAMGIQDSDDEEEAGDSGNVDWETKIENMLGAKRKIADVSRTSDAAGGGAAAGVVPLDQLVTTLTAYVSFFKLSCIYTLS